MHAYKCSLFFSCGYRPSPESLNGLLHKLVERAAPVGCRARLPAGMCEGYERLLVSRRIRTAACLPRWPALLFSFISYPAGFCEQTFSRVQLILVQPCLCFGLLRLVASHTSWLVRLGYSRGFGVPRIFAQLALLSQWSSQRWLARSLDGLPPPSSAGVRWIFCTNY